MSPRPDVSKERKNQILNAAETVFTHKGIDQARMDDIVQETGLSKGTLYWYFKSKDDIIIAILDRIFQREFKQLDALTAAGGSAAENLRQFMEVSIKDLTAIIHLMPVAYEFLSLAFRNTTVQKVIKRYFRRYMDILVPIIQRGIDSGEFRAVDAGEVAVAAGAIFEGTLLLWVYDKSIVQPERHIRSGIDLLLEGILADR
jgi:AcrR family transcriptional regulator